MKPLKSEGDPLAQAVAAFIRDALAHRYALENIRRFPAFGALPDQTLKALHDFLLFRLFPDWEERLRQDCYFEKLLALLDNPRRLAPLTAVALKSLFRFGRELPKAVEAGKRVISAFEATRGLEYTLTELIREQNPPSLEPDDVAVAAAQAMTIMGKSQFTAFVADTVSLMELLAQRSLLKTGASVLGDITDAMRKRPEAYDDDERDGSRYALRIMSEGMALFETLSPAMVGKVLSAIPEVEIDWFDSVTRNISS